MSESEVNSFLEFNGWKVWFEKIGSGDNPVLLIPATIGTGRTDFEELLEDEDGLDLEKFTVITVDPPGLGRSRPPVRKYGANVYNNDCECYHSIMKNLGYDHYSIIGFSEGTRVALLMAVKYPESIISLTLTALTTFYSNKTSKALLSDNSVVKWNNSKLNPYLKVYKTTDEIQKMWNRYLKFIEFYNQYFPEDLMKNKYQNVECRTLITHGDQDTLIELEQPLIISERLNNVKLYRFPNGGHDAHQRYPREYSKLVQEHILTQNSYSTTTICDHGNINKLRPINYSAENLLVLMSNLINENKSCTT